MIKKRLKDATYWVIIKMIFFCQTHEDDDEL
jgi:hypothetical protein